MLLAEELILLLLDDDSGQWLVRRRRVHRAVQVALVVELLGRRRVALDDDGALVAGLSGTTGGDRVLESMAEDVVGAEPGRSITHRPGRTRALLARMRRAGLLRRSLLRRSRHLPRESSSEAQVRDRLRAALLGTLPPERHTALLVAIVFELDLLPTLLPEQDVPLMSARAAEISSRLREDQHYFPATSEEDDHHGLGPGDVLEGIGAALEVLDALSVMVRVVSLPVRVVLRVLGELP